MKGLVRSRVVSVLRCAIAVALVLFFSASAYAGTSTDMPWEEPLQQLADSFTNSVARSLLVLATVALGFALAFSEGPVLRKVLGVILGCAIAATATSFALTFFGFSGGATF